MKERKVREVKPSFWIDRGLWGRFKALARVQGKAAGKVLSAIVAHYVERNERELFLDCPELRKLLRMRPGQAVDLREVQIHLQECPVCSLASRLQPEEEEGVDYCPPLSWCRVKCPFCGEKVPEASADEWEECPGCGAIYWWEPDRPDHEDVEDALNKMEEKLGREPWVELICNVDPERWLYCASLREDYIKTGPGVESGLGIVVFVGDWPEEVLERKRGALP